MDYQKVIADFQLVKNRVAEFIIETKPLDTKGTPAKLDFDIDYKVLEISEEPDKFIGVIAFETIAKAKIKNMVLFKMNLKMEGVFFGNSEILKRSDFETMLELNGIATLSNLSRAYILSVSALSGLNPPIKLPMINIHKLKDLKKQEKAETND
jgi:preprotein translocase subunit SecB